jgi:hypothetical protein
MGSLQLDIMMQTKLTGIIIIVINSLVFIFLCLIFSDLGTWLWSKVVQNCLDHLRDENGAHRVRFQRKVLLPTGGRIEDFYNFPERYGGKKMLIPVPEDVINKLIAEHMPDWIFQFGSDEFNCLAEATYTSIGSPALDVENCWNIWRIMIDIFENVGSLPAF